MFGPQLPAHGFFIRHAKNLECTNVEIACEAPDEPPAFILNDVQGADFFRIRVPRESAGRTFSLASVTDFRALATRGLKDTELGKTERQTL